MSRRKSRAICSSGNKGFKMDPVDEFDLSADERTQNIFKTALPWQQPHKGPHTDALSSTLSSAEYGRTHLHGAARRELEDEEVVLCGSGSRPGAVVRNLIRSYSYFAQHDEVEHSNHTRFQIFEDASSNNSPKSSSGSPCVRKAVRTSATSGDIKSGFNLSYPSQSFLANKNTTMHRFFGQDQQVTRPSQARRSVPSSALTEPPQGYSANFATTTSEARAELVYLGEALTPKRNSPRHEWTEGELEALFVLRRWYTNAASDAAAILNKVFEKELIVRQQPKFHKSMIDAQWNAGLMQHPVRVAVCFDTSFDDSNGKYNRMRRRLELAAREVNVQLYERTDECSAIARMKRKAKEKVPVRQNDAVLERRTEISNNVDGRRQTTLHEHKDTAPVAKRLKTMRQRALKGPQFTCQSSLYTVPAIEQATAALNLENASVSIALTGTLQTPNNNGRANDDENSLYVQESNLALASPQTMPWKEMPCLFFRTFDEESAGVNSAELFRAAFFHPDDGNVAQPLQTDHALFPYFTANHLWRRQTASPFISVTGSLLWAVHKARQSLAQGKQPYISVIDADLAVRDSSVYYVNDILAKQKRDGTLKGPLQSMRYRATQEWWVWGQIPKEAIVHVVSFAHLCALADAVPGVSAVLRLDDLKPDKRVLQIHRGFFIDPVLLDTHAGAALGGIIAILGLGPTSNENHLAKMVSNLVQGWAIKTNQDSQAPSACERICVAFTRALRFFADRTEIPPDGWEARAQDAFVQGVITGAEWNSGLRGRKRLR